MCIPIPSETEICISLRYQLTIFLCFQKNKFKYEHVGTCLFHKTPFLILFGPVLGHYWGYVRPNIPLRSSQNCNVYWPTLLAKYSSLISMNMKGRVRTCFCHKTPFFIIFGPVLGGINDPVYPIPSKIEISISLLYQLTIFPWIHKKIQVLNCRIMFLP